MIVRAVEEIADTTPQTFTFAATCAVIVLGASICPDAFRVATRQALAPTLTRLAPLIAAPEASGYVTPLIVIEVEESSDTTPQTLTVTDVFAGNEIELGDTIWPKPLSAAFKQTVAPTET